MWRRIKGALSWLIRTTMKVLQIRSGDWDYNASPPLDDKHFLPGPPDYRP